MSVLRQDPLHQQIAQRIPWKQKLLSRLVDSLVVGKSGLGTRQRRAFFLAARHFCPVLVADTGKYKFYVSTHDNVVSNHVFNYGNFEETYLHASFRVLAALGYSDFHGKTFIEIGANIGTTSVVVMSEYGFERGLFFEPEPANVKLLRCNLITNDLDAKTLALPYAVSDADTELKLGINRDNEGDHRILTTVSAEVEVTTVQAVRLDSILTKHNYPAEEIGFVWIDTQGHEAQVLGGARQLLESNAPVQLEFWPFGLQQAGGFEALLEILQKHYTHFTDVREASGGDSAPPRLRPIAEITQVAAELQSIQSAETDLIFVKQ